MHSPYGRRPCIPDDRHRHGRRTGWLTGYAGPAAASAAALPIDRARTFLAALARTNLITEHPRGRYTVHDLLRVYAADLSRTIDPDRLRRAAVHRVLDHHLHTAYAAERLLYPARGRRRNLATGLDPRHLSRPAGHWRDQTVTGRAAVAAAGRLADLTAQAGAHRLLARAYRRLGRFDDAHTLLRQALDLYRDADHRRGQGPGPQHDRLEPRP
jgi:hypothetical protein